MSKWTILEQSRDGVKDAPAYDPTLWERDPEYAAKKLEKVETGLKDEAYLYAELLEVLVQVAQPGDSVLDVGCAGGHYCKSINQALPGLACIGMDITESYLRVARATLGPLFVRGDVRDLPFADGSFDHTMCLFVLVHLDQDGLRKAVRELVRVTRRNILMAGYFSLVRFAGRQGDFIYDIVDLHQIIENSPGWVVRLPKDTETVDDLSTRIAHRTMKRRVEFQLEDGSWSGGDVNLDVWSYVWLVNTNAR